MYLFCIWFQMIFQYSRHHRGSTASPIRLMAPQSRRSSTHSVSIMRNPATLGFLLDLHSKGSEITFVFVTHLFMSLIQPVTSEYHFMHLTDPPSSIFSIVHPQELSLARLLSHGPKCHWVCLGTVGAIGLRPQRPCGGEQWDIACNTEHPWLSSLDVIENLWAHS